MKILWMLAVLFAQPKREEEWTCPKCNTKQGAGRGHCMRGCGTRGPLAPQPRSAQPEGASS